MPSESVKVIVRVRPMNERERNKNCTNIVTTDVPNLQITLANPNETETSKVFSYDALFAMDSLQQTVYEAGAFSLVESVIEGYNGTIFAYGQTGCGKTHTMMGVPNDENLKGVIPRAFDHIFGRIKGTTGGQKTHLIQCSFIEIYNEEIRDLIGEDNKLKLDLKENADKSVFIKGLSKHVVTSVNEIQKLMNLGFKNRSVGETAMNKDSSRSHSIFTIYVETQENDPKGDTRITLGKLNLVDLAGSERQSKTGATGDRLKEANKINLSLSALGNVISALVDGKSQHIPYRDSKLTRLLQDSLGGNTKTVMIANVSPASDNYDETLGTLRYASRAKNIKNQPKVNEDPKDALLREYADEINRLKEQLKEGGGGGAARGQSNGGTPTKVRRQPSSKNNLDEQLKAKDNAINEEKLKREDLEKKLKAMQEQMVKGGTANKTEKESNEKYNVMAQKLKDQEAKHDEILREKAQKEEEALMAEKKYANLQEEVEEQRKIIKRLRKKCKDAVNEIKDLEREHELNKEDLLDTIRLLERDVKINNAIMSYMVSPDELEKIRGKARWRDDRNEFVVPPFIVRAKKVQFPKLAGVQAVSLVQEEWKNRDIEFQENKYKESDEDEYGGDDDWDDQGSPSGSKYDASPPRTGQKQDKYANYNQGYGGNKHVKSESLNREYANNMFYDNKGPSNLLKNSNQADLRGTFRGGMQGFASQPLQNQPPPKKNSNAAVRLDPISQGQLATINSKGDFTPEKSFKAPQGGLGTVTVNNSMQLVKGKPQLQPINFPNGNNPKTMKLQFKATLLINNDGSNAELQNMSSHVKGY